MCEVSESKTAKAELLSEICDVEGKSEKLLRMHIKKKRQEERDEREKNEAGDRSTLPLPMVSNSSWVLVDTNSKIPIGGQLREELWPCLDKK